MAYVGIVKFGATAKSVNVNAAAATYGAVAADEIALYVGANVTARRKGLQIHNGVRKLVELICKRPRAATAAGSIGLYSMPPGGAPGKHAYAAVLEADPCDEDVVGLLVGRTIAPSLARSGPVRTAVLAALERYKHDVGVKA